LPAAPVRRDIQRHATHAGSSTDDRERCIAAVLIRLMHQRHCEHMCQQHHDAQHGDRSQRRALQEDGHDRSDIEM